MSDKIGELGDELEEIIRAALDPAHPKFEIRAKALSVLIRDKSMYEDLFMDKITYKLKIPESAKAGKDGRGIGDYSTPGSLLAPFLVPILKNAFSKRIEHGGAVIRFVDSTNAKDVDSIVTEMYQSACSYFIFFSDDMMCKIVRDGKVEYFNLDISACDRSNTPSVFRRLEWFFGDTAWDGLMKRACSQCKQPLLIRNPENSEEWITALVDFEKEFSGTILTTLLNNIASSAICLSIVHRLLSGPQQSTSSVVSDSAFAVGYVVTAESCEGPEDLQFLKMSFWEDEDGLLHSFLNVGAMIRGFGTCWMDYPLNLKRKERLEDAIRFRNWGVLQGYKNSGSNDLLEALRASPGCQRPGARYNGTVALTQLSRELAHKAWDSESPRLPVPVSAILARYRISQQEWSELCAITRRGDVGDIIHHAVVQSVLHRDYGYSLDSTNN